MDVKISLMVTPDWSNDIRTLVSPLDLENPIPGILDSIRMINKVGVKFFKYLFVWDRNLNSVQKQFTLHYG